MAADERESPAARTGPRRRFEDREIHHHVHLGLLAGVATAIGAIGVLPFGDETGLLLRVPLLALLVVGATTVSDRGHLARVRVSEVGFGALGALVTMWLIRGGGVAGAVAIGVVGLAAGATGRLSTKASHVAAPLYVGSFVGATASVVLANGWWILGAGAIAGLLWSWSREAWIGVGGKMGTIAFVASWTLSRVAVRVEHTGPVSVSDVLSHHPWGAVAMATAGALTTWHLAVRGRSGAVLASAGTSLAAASALALFVTPTLAAAWSSAWLGGSFVGMTAPSRMYAPNVFLVVAGLIDGTALVGVGDHFAGIGGMEGSFALISVLVVVGLGRVLGLLRRRRAVSAPRPGA